MTYKNVRALERGLEVLLILNQKNACTIKDITEATDIPRPTIYRLLETLELQGFIAKSQTDDRWHVTLKSKALGSGYQDETWVARHAVPHMIDLGKRLLWPVDLVTFQNYEMVVRESTHSLSPFSIDHGIVGQSLPLLKTSGGRCFLAFCGDTERSMILEGLKTSGRLEEGYMQSDLNIDYMFGQIRSLGLAFRREGFRSHTMSMSAPIWADNRVIACLTMIIIASAMSFEAALDKYGQDVKDTAAKISIALETRPG